MSYKPLTLEFNEMANNDTARCPDCGCKAEKAKYMFRSMSINGGGIQETYYRCCNMACGQNAMPVRWDVWAAYEKQKAANDMRKPAQPVECAGCKAWEQNAKRYQWIRSLPLEIKHGLIEMVYWFTDDDDHPECPMGLRMERLDQFVDRELAAQSGKVDV